jgi:sortase A
MMVLGVALIAIPAIFWLNATYYQWNETKQWQSLIKSEKLPESQSRTLSTGVKGQTADTTESVQAQAADLVDRGPIKPGENVALLSIPKINLKLSVIEGESWTNLATGPVRVSKTARIGDRGTTLVSGHRTMFGAPFHDLHKIAINDELILYTKKAAFSYEVSDIKRVNPDDWRDITEGGNSQLILSTCDPIYSAAKRLLIISKMRSVQPLGTVK